jgi:hypothetical protein
MCRTTLQGAFRQAVRASGVKKSAHIHSLRQNAECRKMPSEAGRSVES